MPGDAMPWGMPRGPRSAVAESRRRPRAADARSTAQRRGSPKRSWPPPRGVRIGQGRSRSASCRAARSSGMVPERVVAGLMCPRVRTPHPNRAVRRVAARLWRRPPGRRGFQTTSDDRCWRSGCPLGVWCRRGRARGSHARGSRSRDGISHADRRRAARAAQQTVRRAIPRAPGGPSGIARRRHSPGSRTWRSVPRRACRQRIGSHSSCPSSTD